MDIPLGLSFDDVLLVPQKSEIESRAEVDLKTEITPGFFLDIPIVATNMDSVTGVDMAVAMSKKGGLALIPRFEIAEAEAEKIAAVKKKKARVFGTIGLRDNYLRRTALVVKAGADGLFLDVAHGHMAKTLEAIIKVKNKFSLPLIAGTVATYEAADDLFAAGTDAIKVGVGAGSTCVTRVVAGCGVPQITAVSEAARAKKRFKNKFIMADGGMKNSGDIVKALAAGASFVSLGSLLAGTDEAPGEVVEKDGVIYKEFNGSTSGKEKDRQMKNHNGHKSHFKLHVEGVEALVRCKGPVSDILDSLCAGIQSGFSYCGARNITELWKRAKFVQITHAGLLESRAHSVILTS